MANINDFAAEINRQLAFYANFTEQEINATAKQVAEQTVTLLKKTSPKSKRRNTTKKYNSGWTTKKVRGRYVVYNENRFNLTQILERPHALRDGGRSKAQPHIKKAELKANSSFERNLTRRLSQR